MDEEVIKIGFFKRLWFSITKIERYPYMATEGARKAFSYLIGLIFIISIIFSIAMMFKTQDFGTVLDQASIEETEKQEILEYINNTPKAPLYLGIFIISIISSYTVFFIATMSYVLIISVFGYFSAIFLKIKMKYVAVFNMSIYAITLSAILELIYTITNLFVEFISNYFSIAYLAIACIYLISAIFIIKSEFIKKQAELNKIKDAQNEIEEGRSKDE